MKTLELVKSSVTENEYSGYYLITNTQNNNCKLYNAREKSEAITKAIDNPALGFKVELIAPTWEEKRIATLMEMGMTKEEAENDFFVQQSKNVNSLKPKELPNNDEE